MGARPLIGLTALVAGVSLLAMGCPKSPPAPLSPPGHLVVMHTNDLHGHYLPEPADWLPGSPKIGGFVRIEQEVRAIRGARGAANTLLLDGGDMLTGTPLTAVKEEGAWGTPMLRFMEAVGYDGWVIGNHEFDRGLSNLGVLVSKSPMQVLSANLRRPSAKEEPLFPSQSFSRVYTVNGLRVGVIGGTTDQLRGLVSPADWGLMHTMPVADAVRAEVSRLDPQTDLIIALTHIGVDADRKLAAAVPGIDLIVGGHSHTPLKEVVKQGDTLIVQAGSYGRSLGVVELVVENDAIASSKYELRDLTLDTATVAPDASLQGLATTYETSINALYGEVVAKAPTTLDKEYGHESALGRWITDALRVQARVDIGIYNGGGLRSPLRAGPITRRDIFESFPFENAVHLFDITGSQLVGIVLGNIAADAGGKRGFLSLSGVSWTWRTANGTPEVVSLNVGSLPVDLGRTYRAAATSYIVDQWAKHLGFEPARTELLGLNDFEVAVAHAREAGVIDNGQLRGVRVE
jgi:2',3'-cyclic-nucleotide 2'-phosphodiesterase (5'-nucleotidase family)